MNTGTLLVGIVVGMLLFLGGLTYSSTASLDHDAVCQDRLGQNWTHQETLVNQTDTEVGVVCTNGTATEEISVDVEVNT